MLATDKCFIIKRLQDYKVFVGTKLINNTTWNMSLFGLFSDKHFPVYGQNLRFSPYTGKYESAKNSYVYTRFYIYNIISRCYINVRLQFLDLYISHSTNKNPSRTKRIWKMFFGLSDLQALVESMKMLKVLRLVILTWSFIDKNFFTVLFYKDFSKFPEHFFRTPLSRSSYPADMCLVKVFIQTLAQHVKSVQS